MTGSERRDQIINQIKKSSIPVSGAQLAKEFDVSRQVIVQDIALIRAAGHEIISTNRGYLLNTPHSVNRIFKVNPTDEVLELKRGAQIMFVKNDSSGEHRYYNGMIGEVVNVSALGIEVRSKGSEDAFMLQEEEWMNAKYVLDEETKGLILK